MALFLDKDESFSMSAYVESPGYQRMILEGYLVDRRADGTYIAPLIPQLFYGVNGNQLQTWQQYLPNVGNQVVLSRSGGHPSVPREDLWWRKVEEKPSVEQVTIQQQAQTAGTVPSWVIPVVVLGFIGAVAVYALWKR